MEELVRRPRVRPDDDVFLDEVDVDSELVDQHPVLDVAVQAVGLLDKDTVDLLLAHELHHAAERGSTGAGSGLDLDEFLEDCDSVLLCVVAQELHLSGNREAVALLFGGGDARVQDGRGTRFRTARLRCANVGAAARRNLLSACHRMHPSLS